MDPCLMLCRSCMKEVVSKDSENLYVRAVDMFTFCTSIQVMEDDKLPKQFCCDCIMKIESAFTFIKEAQRIDAILKNLVSRAQTSIIIGPDTKKYASNRNIEIKYESSEIILDINCVSTDDSYTVISNVDETREVLKYDDKGSDCIKGSVDKLSYDGVTKKHVCGVCKKVFTSKLWLTKHVRNEHTHPKYACEHCQKKFSKKSDLTQHSICHSKERKYSCAQCGKCYKRRNQLANHARAHNDLRPYECDKCHSKFKQKSVLKTHMSVHDGDKPFLCSFCGWSFARVGNLEVHMRKHTGDKPYSCDECTFRAAFSTSLKRHKRRHRLARTYVCKHCNKGFYDSSGLIRHSRVHTGELPFQCPLCARAFSDSWKRKTHLMRAHGHALHDIPRMRRDGATL